MDRCIYDWLDDLWVAPGSVEESWLVALWGLRAI